MKSPIDLDVKAIERYLSSEGGGRYEITARHDGLIVIEFFNKHGSLFDVTELSDWLKDAESEDCA